MSIEILYYLQGSLVRSPAMILKSLEDILDMILTGWLNQRDACVVTQSFVFADESVKDAHGRSIKNK